jgi:hypothetical protein
MELLKQAILAIAYVAIAIGIVDLSFWAMNP